MLAFSEVNQVIRYNEVTFCAFLQYTNSYYFVIIDK